MARPLDHVGSIVLSTGGSLKITRGFMGTYLEKLVVTKMILWAQGLRALAAVLPES